MKVTVCIALLSAAAVNAHYKFPNLVVNGQTMSPWTHVRETNSYYSNGPVENVNSIDIRCNERGGRPRAQIATVNAGGTVGFLANPTISHPGPLAFYLAKVPSGQSAADWDGSGNVWFKIYEEQPKFPEFTFASNGKSIVDVRLPSSLPSGDYLIRVEHIGLHNASSEGGAQFYLACGQITVTGGGNGSPGPLVAFPGAYSPSDPGIKLNIYYPLPTSYRNPGPSVWRG